MLRSGMAPSPVARSIPQAGAMNPSRTPTFTRPKAQTSGHRPSATPPPSSLTLAPADHPVEVVGRIREHPEGSDKPSAIQVVQNGHGQAVRVKMDQGYRDFSFDGVSLAEKEDLHVFYSKYVETRIDSVKLGGQCTIIMYGPTGAGKSRTMFGSAKEPGIAIRALQHIMSSSHEETLKENRDSPGLSHGRTKVNITVLEIYNEEIFDLSASNAVTDKPKHNTCRVKLEIMGRKAKNAATISGSEADKVTREIAKLEKRRIVKSTLCNERSSRSHCMLMVDVPSVGGRVVLVDMAGSENIDQAGVGIEAKLQTGKINQGNIALKRVVEAIANGDLYIPFRDSKLTMLLQDSFEDDRAKILMILCASPDIRDVHKTIGTLEYGAKAKCIIQLPRSPVREKLAAADLAELSVLEERIRAMDEYISKLQQENGCKEKEKEGVRKELMQKEQELTDFRERIKEMEPERKETGGMEPEQPYNEVRLTLQNKLIECQKMVNNFLKSGEKKLEEHILKQQREIHLMHIWMQEIENKLKDLQEMDHNQIAPMGDSPGRIKEQVDREIGNIREQVGQLEGKRKFSQLGLGYISNDDIESKYGSNKSCKKEHDSSSVYNLHGQTTDCCNSQAALLSSSVNPGVSAPSSSMGIAKLDVEKSSVNFPKEENKEFPVVHHTSVDACSSDVEDSRNKYVSLTRTKPDDTINLPCSQIPNLVQCSHKFDFRTSGELFSTGPDDCYMDDANTLRHDGFERTGWLPVIPEGSDEGERMSEDNDDMYMDKHIESVNSSVNLEGSADKSNVNGNVQKDSIASSSLLVHDGKQDQPFPQSSSDAETINCVKSFPLMNRILKTEIDDGGTFPNGSCSGREDMTVGDTEFRGRNAALAARRSRIETIFLLCGNHRELAAHKYMKDPANAVDFEGRFANDGSSKESHSTTFQSESIIHVERDSPTIISYTSADSRTPKSSHYNRTTECVTEMNISPVISEVQISTNSSEMEPSENIPPGQMLGMSPKKLSSAASFSKPSLDIKENQTPFEADNEKCDVYVKWETAGDTSRKLIQIIRISINSSLAELRKAIEPHLPEVKQDFTFLMLGDPSGAPVEYDKESNIRIASLPDCHNQKGCRLACLRTPLRRTLTTVPFTAMENQINSKSNFVLNQNSRTETNCNSTPKSSINSGVFNSGILRSHKKSNVPARSQVKVLRL